MYKILPEFPKYHIYDDGRIYGLKRKKFLKPCLHLHPSNVNYFRVCLSKNGKSKWYYLSRLIAKTFIPNPQNLPCVCHIDSNPKNNCVSNLRWDTQKNNVADSIRRGTFQRGEKAGKARLNRFQIQRIRLMYKLGLSCSKIGAIFKVHKNTIIAIKNRQSWAHIS